MTPKNYPKKKTKIVCTIGPATENEKTMSDLLDAGMNVMRLNFSHGDFEEHQARIDTLKKISEISGKTAAVLQDLCGPKIRIKEFKNGSINLQVGQTFTLTTKDIEGDEEMVSVNYPKLHEEVFPGDIIYLHDGRKKLEVVRTKEKEIECRVLIGGELKGKKGLNFPDSKLSLSSLTEKDYQDLEFGIKNNVDFIALSFVRTARDIRELREFLNKRNSNAGIIAKIETPQAVKNIDEIIELSDGIMVARGDLAIEIPIEHMPHIQKLIINKCNEAAKPVITATQMLESMIYSQIPTRAEVSDIANAILDGTDAVMLSEETTLGNFPVHAVEIMSKVAMEVENDFLRRQLLGSDRAYKTVGESVAASVVKTADRIDARYVVALTNGGYGARMTTRHRGHKHIIVATPNELTFRKSHLYFGCTPIMTERLESFDQTVERVKPLLIELEMATKGDQIVIISSIPFGSKRESNGMLVETL